MRRIGTNKQRNNANSLERPNTNSVTNNDLGNTTATGERILSSGGPSPISKGTFQLEWPRTYSHFLPFFFEPLSRYGLESAAPTCQRNSFGHFTPGASNSQTCNHFRYRPDLFYIIMCVPIIIWYWGSRPGTIEFKWVFGTMLTGKNDGPITIRFQNGI